MWVNPSRNPSTSTAAAPSARPACRSGASRSRSAMVTGLIHSCSLVSSGRGRYQQMFSNSTSPARADGVVGELLAVDELLDDDLRHVPDHRQDGVEIGGRVGPVGVRRASAGDRLDDRAGSRGAPRPPTRPRPCPRSRAPACAGPPRRAPPSSAPCPGTAPSAAWSARAGPAPRAAARRASCTAPTGTRPGRAARAGPGHARRRPPRPRRPASRPARSAPALPAPGRGTADGGWSPMPMTVAPAAASPRAKNAISAGYPGEIMMTFIVVSPARRGRR